MSTRTQKNADGKKAEQIKKSEKMRGKSDREAEKIATKTVTVEKNKKRQGTKRKAGVISPPAA